MLKLENFILCSFIAVAVYACSNGDENPANTALELQSTGSVSTYVEQVNVSVAGVDVHVGSSDDATTNSNDEGGAWISASTRREIVDLMKLRQNATALADVDVYGPITQIRLRLAQSGSNNVVRRDGSVCPLDTSHIDPTGVKIIHPFLVIDPPEEGRKTIRVELDIQESLKEVAPCSYTLRPVLRVARVTD